MSNRYDDLVLHLKLDDIDISTNTVPDSSNSHLNAKVHDASLVADDTFGACLDFDEQDDYVEVSNLGLSINPAHTIEAWIKVDGYPKARSWILMLGRADERSHKWLLNTETAGENLGKKAQFGAWGELVDQATLIGYRRVVQDLQIALNALSGEYQGTLTQIQYAASDPERQYFTQRANAIEADQNKIKTELGRLQAAFEMAEVEMPLAKWVHMATIYDGKNLICYLNGQPIGSPKAATFNLTEKRLTLAKRGIESEQNFQGKIAHVRIYRRALSQSEIREDMDTDKVSLPAYRRGHPIGFSLCDLDENYVLYIGDDPKEEYKLNLELRNTSAQAIRFEPQGDQATKEKHHFELVFRNGVLSDTTLKKLREKKEEIILKDEPWDLYAEDSQTGTVSVYFLYKDTSKIFGPGGRLVIPLRNISANPGSGARGTRIELKLNHLAYVGETSPITGSRIQHLQIISHLGSRRVPLHVSFAGSNRILNDGYSANTLVLQLMNVLKSEQESSVDVTLTTKTEFRISFDVESTKEVAPWSLCTEAEIQEFYNAPDSIIVAELNDHRNVVFDAKGRPKSDTGRWKVNPAEKGQGESPVWSFSPRQDIVLQRDGYIPIYLSNIRTSLPSGLTNLYLEYKGIDGFWDGQVVCLIEKAPLLFYDVRDHQGNYTHELRVGIGCVKPEAKLEIALAASDADSKPLVIRNRKDKVNYLTILKDGKVGIGKEEPKASLDVNGEIRANFFRAGEGYSKRLPVGKQRVGTGTDITATVWDEDIKWYRIAKIVAPKPLTSAGAEFSLRATIAGRTAQVLTFRIVGFSGLSPISKQAIARLTILSNTGSLVFAKARVVMPRKVADACEGYLEIFARQWAEGETDVNFSIYDNLNIPAWQPIGWEEQPDPVSSTFAACEYSLDHLFLVADRAERLSLDSNGDLLIHGKVGIGTNRPGATLAINGGLHVGGDADPGDKNLVVDGKASIKGGLHVGTPLDGHEGLSVDRSLLVNGSGIFLDSLIVRNSIGLLHLGTQNFAAEIKVEPALVFKTQHDGKWHDSMTVHPPGGEIPTLIVAGSISEKVDIVPARTNWEAKDGPVMTYFRKRLRGKPPGTMLRAICQAWKGHYWQGWVDYDGDIAVIPIYFSGVVYALRKGEVYAD
jgi:concanavalin A-like lectin/glucanase superfamily protein